MFVKSKALTPLIAQGENINVNKHGRTQLALGVILILAGAWFLLDKTNPQIHLLFAKYIEWPFNMFLIGAGILLVGLVTGSPGLAVPASIVAGVGAIVYYQGITKSQDAWYTWVLILGFIGIGNILQGLLGENTARNLREGLKLIAVSAAIFIAFASFFGDLKFLGNYGPAVLLILVGLWVLGNGIYRSYRARGEA
jgi:hypothetical protein